MDGDRSRRDGTGGSGLTGRFLLACVFASAATIVLGLRFIDNLFDDGRTLRTDWNLAALATERDLRPPAARNQLQVFFTDDGMALKPAIVPVEGEPTPAERGRLALEALLDRPPDGSLQSPVPKGTALRAFYLLPQPGGGPVLAVIDVSEEIRQNPLGGLQAELLCVHAVVNTALANCENADSARILINGAAAETLWGQVDISEPLAPWTPTRSEGRSP